MLCYKRHRNYEVCNELPSGTVGWVVASGTVGFESFVVRIWKVLSLSSSQTLLPTIHRLAHFAFDQLAKCESLNCIRLSGAGFRVLLLTRFAPFLRTKSSVVFLVSSWRKMLNTKFSSTVNGLNVCVPRILCRKNTVNRNLKWPACGHANVRCHTHAKAM